MPSFTSDQSIIWYDDFMKYDELLLSIDSEYPIFHICLFNLLVDFPFVSGMEMYIVKDGIIITKALNILPAIITEVRLGNVI